MRRQKDLLEMDSFILVPGLLELPMGRDQEQNL